MEQKVSGNSFRKFRLTSRDCPFILEIWKFRKFPVPFGISGMISALVPLVVNLFCLDQSYKMAANRHTTLDQNNLPYFEPVLDCLSYTKKLGFYFLENCGVVVPNLHAVGQFAQKIPQVSLMITRK